MKRSGLWALLGMSAALDPRADWVMRTPKRWRPEPDPEPVSITERQAVPRHRRTWSECPVCETRCTRPGVAAHRYRTFKGEARS